MIQLYCATGNAGKLREFRLAARDVPVAIELLPGYREIAPCAEDCATFPENAVLKAMHYGRCAGGLLFADDSGLVVDALDGAPGVHSARFAGPQATDEDNNRRLVEELRGVAWRTARFVCAMALVKGGRVCGLYRGVVEGVILHEPRGECGFGYDPLFYYPPFGRTLGEVSNAEKFAVSHRGQAFRAMLRMLGSV